ncbi:hypothetical protein V7114_06870 [Neobacillus niacini]|uniref:hypothetical protein n=1 Tax=Neobacillus niacini TaxID=86668 RepID=UPI002FFE2167
MILEPYDTLGNVTVEVHGFDMHKPDMLIWSCTKDQSENLANIVEIVKAQGYSMFELREITEINRLYDINDAKGADDLSK